MDSGAIRDIAPEFLRLAYETSVNKATGTVMLLEVATKLQKTELGESRPVDIDKYAKVAQYLGQRGLLQRQSDGWTMFSITREGIDEVEGRNKPQDSGAIFNIYGGVHGSVVGTHNRAELTNTFDFSSIRERIESEGGEDKEELNRALEQVERLLERGEYLDRGQLSEFSESMERHSWFTGAVAQMLIGFATQAVTG